MEALAVERARASDRASIAGLLTETDLPAEGLDDLAEFFVVRRAGAAVGCVGLEHYGDTALLRSLAVAASHRGKGLSTGLMRAALERAREMGREWVVVLTFSTPDLFERYGFERVDRKQVDPRALDSWQFQVGVCSGATCLRLRL